MDEEVSEAISYGADYLVCVCDITYKAELTQPQFEIKDANRQIRAGSIRTR